MKDFEYHKETEEEKRKKDIHRGEKDWPRERPKPLDSKQRLGKATLKTGLQNRRVANPIEGMRISRP